MKRKEEKITLKKVIKSQRKSDKITRCLWTWSASFSMDASEIHLLMKKISQSTPAAYWQESLTMEN